MIWWFIILNINTYYYTFHSVPLAYFLILIF